MESATTGNDAAGTGDVHGENIVTTDMAIAEFAAADVSTCTL